MTNTLYTTLKKTGHWKPVITTVIQQKLPPPPEISLRLKFWAKNSSTWTKNFDYEHNYTFLDLGQEHPEVLGSDNFFWKL